MKYKTLITLPVELIFDALEPLQVNDEQLPAQLDITRALLTVIGPGGKPRQIDILRTISEEQLMLFEDEIEENYGVPEAL